MIGRGFATLLGAVLWLAWTVASAGAQGTCGGIYTVKRGDSLSHIAERHYKDARLWTAIHQDNLTAIGPVANQLLVGTRLTLACRDGLPVGLPGGQITARAPDPMTLRVITPVSAAAQPPISLLTGDDFAPFTSRSAPGGGLMTELVEAAMRHAAPERGHAVHWVNDWTSHLDPLLSNALLDMGFPWLKPDCAAEPAQFRCENFLFSEPMFEMLVVLITDAARPVAFESDADLLGRVLCRPQGFYTHDLDRDGRNWLSQGLITLRQPETIAACFDLLLAGEVDAVAINEFTGRAAMADLGLAERVRLQDGRPLSIESLHVVVHKSHPEAQALLQLVSDGLRGIRADGAYQNIIDRHLSQLWAAL